MRNCWLKEFSTLLERCMIGKATSDTLRLKQKRTDGVNLAGGIVGDLSSLSSISR